MKNRVRLQKMATKKKITLAEWIWKLGDDEVARRTGINQGSIRQYRYLTRSPAVKQAKKFIVAANGKLDWESIFGPAEEINSKIAQPRDVSKTRSPAMQVRLGVEHMRS